MYTPQHSKYTPIYGCGALGVPERTSSLSLKLGGIAESRTHAGDGPGGLRGLSAICNEQFETGQAEYTTIRRPEWDVRSRALAYDAGRCTSLSLLRLP